MSTSVIAAGKGIYSVITTDYGGDCDDQKAISQHIASMGPNDKAAFIISGPHPRQAADAVAQAYFAKTGKYPSIALGKQFEAEKVPQEKIYSLINEHPMVDQQVSNPKLMNLESLQAKIDEKIKSGRFGEFAQVVLGPLHSDIEYYNPTRRLSSDPDLKKNWDALPKSAVTQFQRASDEDGNFVYSGNNFQKSEPMVSQDYNSMLSEHGFKRTYFEGAVAKAPEFLLAAQQPTLPGIGKAVATYMENLQVPWANMPGKSGTTPTVSQMHVGMFTPRGEVPFGVHAAGAIPPGFGIERLAKEVCGVPVESAHFAELAAPIQQELDRFDDKILKQLQEQRPDLAHMDTLAMRAEMHSAMLGALQNFAKEQGIKNGSINSFKQLFDEAKSSNIKLNPFTFMEDFKEVLFREYPVLEQITDLAEQQAGKVGAESKSHLEVMTSILGGQGARAVMYDAVTIASARAIDKDPKLAAHFTDNDGSRNVTQAKMKDLAESNQALHKELVSSIRSELNKDGGKLAVI